MCRSDYESHVLIQKLFDANSDLLGMARKTVRAIGARTVAFATAYYVAVRLFETYISPKLGWLLGYAKSPDSYSADMPGKHEAQ